MRRILLKIYVIDLPLLKLWFAYFTSVTEFGVSGKHKREGGRNWTAYHPPKGETCSQKHWQRGFISAQHISNQSSFVRSDPKYSNSIHLPLQFVGALLPSWQLILLLDTFKNKVLLFAFFQVFSEPCICHWRTITLQIFSLGRAMTQSVLHI